MLKWLLEISEFDVQYERRKDLKAKSLADFVAKMTAHNYVIGKKHKWTIFVDGASSSTGSRARILLVGVVIEHSPTLFLRRRIIRLNTRPCSQD